MLRTNGSDGDLARRRQQKPVQDARVSVTVFDARWLLSHVARLTPVIPAIFSWRTSRAAVPGQALHEVVTSAIANDGLRGDIGRSASISTQT